MYSILQLMMAVLNWNMSLNKQKIVGFFLQFIHKDIHYEGEIWLNIFSKTKHLAKFHFTFFYQKTKNGYFYRKKVKPSPNCKMIKLRVFENLFPSLRH